jgi:hypothetical protein
VNNQRYSHLLIAVLVIWIASAALGLYLLTRFDTLVHGQLYNYGLQFDHAWADSYYFYTQLMYIALGVPMALGVFSITIGFKTITEKTHPAPKLKPMLAQTQPKPTSAKSKRRKLRTAG